MNRLKKNLLGLNLSSTAIAGVIVFLFILPAFAGEYLLYMVLSILVFCLFSLSANLLLGYTGLLSFGQGVSLHGTCEELP